MQLVKNLRVFLTIILSGTASSLYIPKQNIAVFGAKGKTGECVIALSKDLGVNTVSLVRPKHDIETSIRNKIYKGDVTSLTDVRQIYEENDITGTIICLGGNTQNVGNDMLTKGTENIIHCIKEFKASPRISIVTSIGSGDTIDEPPLFFKILMQTFLKDAFIDKNNQEALFLDETGIGHNLEYTIVRPSGLTNDNKKQTMVIKKGSGTIPRIDVADVLLNSICDNEFPYIRKAISITSQDSSVDDNGVLFESKIK